MRHQEYNVTIRDNEVILRNDKDHTFFPFNFDVTSIQPSEEVLGCLEVRTDDGFYIIAGGPDLSMMYSIFLKPLGSR